MRNKTIRELETELQQATIGRLTEEEEKTTVQSQIRAVCVTLEAERTELLARVEKIDALLSLTGRTRSYGASPAF